MAIADRATRSGEVGSGALTPRQLACPAKTPSLSAQIVERAFLGKSSPRQAIKAKCLSCSNWQRAEVEVCSVEVCPLWWYRPYQARADGV